MYSLTDTGAGAIFFVDNSLSFLKYLSEDLFLLKKENIELILKTND